MDKLGLNWGVVRRKYKANLPHTFKYTKAQIKRAYKGFFQ